MSSSGLDWSPLVEAWLAKRPEIENKVLGELFRSSFSPIHQWTKQNLLNKMDVLEYNVVSQVILRHFLALQFIHPL